MSELPFKHRSDLRKPGVWDDKEYNKQIELTKKEKTLKAKEITDILENALKKAGFITTKERNYISQNINPFDLVAGDEDTLTLFGFEIKGDTDSYQRLTSQMDSYLFACKEVYLVVHKKKIPEWLPTEIGVIRVFENGDIVMEKSSWYKDQFLISSTYEWDALLKANALGKTSAKTKEYFNLLDSARKNILFNKFFAISAGFNTHKFTKFYPLTDDEKKILIGFDVAFHLKNIRKDTNHLEKRLGMIKKIIEIGVSDNVNLKKWSKK